MHQLHDALVQHNLKPWVDWQDIPPTADWLAEIYTGIENADTFVFVITPDSIASEICGLEVAHAVGVRVVPGELAVVAVGPVSYELRLISSAELAWATSGTRCAA